MSKKNGHKAALICALLLALTACAPDGQPQTAATPEPTPTPTAQPSPTPTPAPTPTPEPTPEPTPTPPPIPDDPAEFVRIQDYLPDVYVELRYATENNFTGQVIYDFTDAYLRYGTLEKLAQAQAALAEQGYSLKIWDAFRPVAAQFALWEVVPINGFVANPYTGYSSHSRGNTVDLTLVLADGSEVEMPTDFDTFSALADRDYSDVSETAAANARILEAAMEEAGFKPYSQEWWHFSDTESYPPEEDFVPPPAQQEEGEKS